ncbi:MAG: arginyltransferase [Phycisphaerae bacterium]
MESVPFEKIEGLSLPLLRGEDHPCAYLPDRTASALYWLGGAVSGASYQQLMDLGFRRSGDVIYRPSCRGCRSCVALRVPVDAFLPTRSQRRALRRNADIRLEVGAPRLDEQRFALFQRYLQSQHDGEMIQTRDGYEQFLVRGFADTLEMAYWLEGRLVSVGIVDPTPKSLSSVYFYFDPEMRSRSLGVYSVLKEIEFCRQHALPYWYAGFYVADCRKMAYKRQFGPNEYLHPDGVWRAEVPKHDRGPDLEEACRKN